MPDSEARSRLNAQLTKFSSELFAGLPEPPGRLVSQMLFNIQSSQDVRLSNIGRSRQEEKRLSGNLKRAELQKERTPHQHSACAGPEVG